MRSEGVSEVFGVQGTKKPTEANARGRDEMCTRAERIDTMPVL
jgi:hypothetical protein